MKSFALLAILVLLFTRLHAQELDAPKQERMFLPSDTLWGYAQFDVAPPHNEIDPNLCASNAGNFGGANAPCNAFARYMLSGLLEVRPFGRGIGEYLLITKASERWASTWSAPFCASSSSTRMAVSSQ